MERKKKRRKKKTKRSRIRRIKRTRRTAKTRRKMTKKKTKIKKKKKMRIKKTKTTRKRSRRRIKRTTNVLLPCKRKKRSLSTKPWTLSARASQKHGRGSRTKDTGSAKSATRAKCALTCATTTCPSRALSSVTMASGWTHVLLMTNAFNRVEIKTN